jgi:hypothetical protein
MERFELGRWNVPDRLEEPSPKLLGHVLEVNTS